MKLLFLPFLFFWFCGAAQAVINIDGTPCDLHGAAAVNSEVYYLNSLKNRYRFPQASNIDAGVTFQTLMESSDPNQFSTDKAVRLQGFVLNVKMGGVESCNCKTKDPAYRDTHIELTPDETKTDPQYRIIVEVTPRLRAIMAKRGVDWSTEGLRRTLKGHYVAITGWLLYDAEHESGAAANDPSNTIGAENWRATCWEVHPITAIEPATSGSAITNHKNKTAPTLAPQGNFNYKTLWIGLAIVLLLLLVFSRRSRR